MPNVFEKAPWDIVHGRVEGTGSALDLVALLITLVIMFIVIRGVKESASFNALMVAFKTSVVLFVIFAGFAYISAKNYSPFMPYGFFSFSLFGRGLIGQTNDGGAAVGVLSGAAITFFAYIGFDCVSTTAEECKRPQRDLPIGIVGSLAISTALYVGVSIVLVGMVPYQTIDIDAPVSKAFGAVGAHWAEGIIAFGAVVGLISVLTVNIMGQPRIFMAMARDGLLPNLFSQVHPVYKTPDRSALISGVCTALIAAFVPMNVLVELVNIGTLFAFTIVQISVIILRKTSPSIERPFVCPYVPIVPIIGSALCILLMLALPAANWVRLVVS